MPQQRNLFGLVLVLLLANAVCRPLWQFVTLDGATFNAIPLICAITGIAIWYQRMSADRARSLDLGAAMIVMMAALTPYATVSWFLTAALAAFMIVRGAGCAKALTILIVSGLRIPASETTMAVMGGPILTADSTVAAAIAEIIGNEVSRVDNMLINDAGHTIFIMSGCSSFASITDALLVAYVSAIIFGAVNPARSIVILTGLALTILLMNATRLAFMTLSPDSYMWIHDGPGATIGQMGIIAATLMSVWIFANANSAATNGPAPRKGNQHAEA